MKNRALVLILFVLLLGTLWYARKHITVRPMTDAVAVSEPVVTPATPMESTSPAATSGIVTPASSEEEAFCKISVASTGIPLTGKLKVWSYAYATDEDRQPGFVAMIQSSECPSGLFSKVRMDNLGRLKEVIDCRNTSKESLMTRVGVQGNIEEHKSEGNKLNLAISGYGYFVLQCDDGMHLSRSGNFYWDGLQTTSGYCRVMDRDGNYFSWDSEDLDERGCAKNGSCVAIVEPDPENVEFINRTTFLAGSDPFTRPANSALVFSNSLEKLDDPSTGPMGPNWDKIKEFIPPKSCPSTLK